MQGAQPCNRTSHRKEQTRHKAREPYTAGACTVNAQRRRCGTGGATAQRDTTAFVDHAPENGESRVHGAPGIPKGPQPLGRRFGHFSAAGKVTRPGAEPPQHAGRPANKPIGRDKPVQGTVSKGPQGGAPPLCHPRRKRNGNHQPLHHYDCDGGGDGGKDS